MNRSTTPRPSTLLVKARLSQNGWTKYWRHYLSGRLYVERWLAPEGKSDVLLLDMGEGGFELFVVAKSRTVDEILEEVLNA